MKTTQNSLRVSSLRVSDCHLGLALVLGLVRIAANPHTPRTTALAAERQALGFIHAFLHRSHIMTALTKREQNKLDKQIEEIVRRRLSGIPINIMDIGKVFDAGRAAYSGVTGQDVEAAVVETYTQLAQKTGA